MRIFTTLLIFSTLLFGIIDKPLEKPYIKNSSSRVLNSVSNYPAILESNTSSDDRNIFIYSEHFRVIFGKRYEDSLIVKDLALNILEYAEKSWEVEIDRLGFQQPNGSDKLYIDIYLGNRGAYNYPKGSYMNISSNYAGYATSYLDGTPYFVLNPAITEKIIQVTIAHEFFHTVQYSYFNGDEMSDDVWYSNIWFLEGTAVFMEDEVFPDNNDYVTLADNYTRTSYKSLDYYNGSSEYGKSLFFKYFQESLGDISVIKDSLENVDETKKFLDIIEESVPNFRDHLKEFGEWLISPENHFIDGELYPQPTIRDMNTTYVAEKYGFLFLQDSGDYYISSNPQYGQTDFSGETQIISSLQDGVIVTNLSESDISTELLKRNLVKPLSIKSGWSLIGNSFRESIYLQDYFSDDFVWILRDGIYLGYSENIDFKTILTDMNIYTDELKSGEGAWIYSNKDREIDFDIKELMEFQDLNSTEYQLKAISGSSISTTYFDQNYTIFYFDNLTQSWRISNMGQEIDGYNRVESLDPMKGYFIKRVLE